MDGGADAEQTARWCKRVADMYAGWVARRHMQGTQRALPSLCPVAGGWRVWRRQRAVARERIARARKRGSQSRCVARVRVAPLWAAESAAEIPASALAKALAAAPASVRRSCDAIASSRRRWCAMPNAAGAPVDSTMSWPAISTCSEPGEFMRKTVLALLGTIVWAPLTFGADGWKPLLDCKLSQFDVYLSYRGDQIMSVLEGTAPRGSQTRGPESRRDRRCSR